LKFSVEFGFKESGKRSLALWNSASSEHSILVESVFYGASRKGAKDAKHKQDYKFEARNPKYKTNYNDGNTKVQNRLNKQFGDLVI